MNYRTLWNEETGQEWTELEPSYPTAPIARHSDPATSHQAAAETQLKLPRYQQELLTVLKSNFGPVTAREAAKVASIRFGGMEDTYRKRMRDLVRLGLAVKVKIDVCEITGKNAQTFRARGH